MKKTLFLTAILGAALCSTAFGGSLTTETTTVSGTVYNGGVYTFSAAGTISTSTHTADQTSDQGNIEAGSTIAWNAFASNQELAYGHTIHLTTNGTYTSNFSPFSFGGLITDAEVTLGRSTSAVELNGTNAVNMDINANTTILGGEDNKRTDDGINIYKGGTWDIAEGKTLTLSATTGDGVVFHGTDTMVNLAGTGTLNFVVNTTPTPQTENGFAAVTYTIGDHLTQNSANLQLNGQAATLADGVLTSTGTIYYVVKDAAFNKASMSSYTAATGFQINDGATLRITEKTSNSNGIIKGNVVVKTGGVLQLEANDALGWSGNNVKTLLVEDGAEVKLTHSSNETFGGALTLQGSATISGDNARWDYFTDSSITVAANATAAINTNGLQLRHDGSQATISMGNNATLNIGANITNGDRGDGTLAITGNHGSGSIINLDGGANGVGLQFGGVTANINEDMTVTQLMLSKNNALTTVNVAANKTLTITGTNTVTSNGSFELANWSRNNVLNIEGTVIANSGITTEGGTALPVINIMNGGTLTMNAGLNAVKREGGNGFTTINVESGATLNAGGTSALADTTLITVNLKDGSTLGGAYGTGTTAVVNKNFALADNATVTLQTASDKELTLNGTLSNATASLVAQGGGTVALGGTEAVSGLSIKEDTNVILNHDAAIGSALTIANGATLTANNALTLNGTASYTGTATSTKVAPTTENGFAQTVTSATVINGNGAVTNNATWTLNGNAATLDGKVLSYSTNTTEYYVNTDMDMESGYIQDITILHLQKNADVHGVTFEASSYVDVVADAKITLDESAVSAGGQGIWLHSGSELNLEGAHGKGSISADGLWIQGGSISAGGDANLGNHNTVAFHEAVVIKDSAISVSSLGMREYTVEGGSVTASGEANIKATLSANDTKTDLLVVTNKSGIGNATLKGEDLVLGTLQMNAGTTVTLGTADSHNYTLAVDTLKVAGEGATLNANLDLTNTETLTLNAALTMGCTVELGDGGITLSGDLLDNFDLTTEGSVTLFKDVEGVTVNGTAYTEPVAASIVFSNVALVDTDTLQYTVSYNADNTVTLNVTTIVPEPATATLSLLALAALASRRRRH